jgi:predicted nuclease with TOPRIM domain
VQKKEIEGELESIKKDIARLTSNNYAQYADSEDLPSLMKYMIKEREKTNKILASVTERIKELSSRLNEIEGRESITEKSVFSQENARKEVPLSDTDVKIVEYVQSKGLACADDIKTFMNYSGRNAACARLNRLHMIGLLDRYQLGHKVYYKYDAGKTTNTLIVSPPQ